MKRAKPEAGFAFMLKSKWVHPICPRQTPPLSEKGSLIAARYGKLT
jgi:hypothetical protein